MPLRVTQQSLHSLAEDGTTPDVQMMIDVDAIQFQKGSSSAPAMRLVFDQPTLSVGRLTGLEQSRMEEDGDAISVAYHRERTQYKLPVQACAGTSVPLPSVIDGAVIDDVTVTAGQRVLLKAQNDPAENGIYVVAATGSPGPARATDMPVGSNAFGMLVYVLETGL